MKRAFLSLLLAAGLALGPALPAGAAPKAKPKAQAQAAPQALQAKSASLTLEGDSSLHKYHSKASKLSLSGQVLPKGADFAAAAAAGGVSQLKVAIAVADMKSDKDGLDKNMQKALKAREHPEITFEMQSYELKLAGETGSATVHGTLTVAGASKHLALQAKAARKGGSLLFSGVQPLKMTDFGIKPPVMMMGMIKTADDISIRYELELAPAL